MKTFVGPTLIVEDDPAIAQLLRIHLTELGLQNDVAMSAESGWEQMQLKNYDLCLLDWMLPKMQGIDLVKKIRDKKIMTKILMLTAKADTDSVVAAIEAGADDYVTKPFATLELLARIRNLLRRNDYEKSLLEPNSMKKNNAPLLTLDQLTIDFTNYRVVNGNEEIHLTPSEFKLLAALIKAQGQVLTRNQLINLVQGDDVTVTDRTVDTHIFTLRKKLSSWSEHVETIRGIGYRILISKSDFADQVDCKA